MKNSRRVQMTQTLLKESLTELLEQQNIHQITIKELCERANVSRSTFYSYYGSQYELLNAIEKEIIEETQKLASKMTSHDEENTRRLLEAHFRYTLEHIRFLRAFSTNGSEDYMLPKRTMQIILLPYIDHRLMQRRPPVSAQEYEHICLFSIFGCISIVKSWVQQSTRMQPQELAAEMMRYINAVIAAGTGGGEKL